MSRFFDGLNPESSGIVEAYRQRVLEMVKESAQELEQARTQLQQAQEDAARAQADMDDAIRASDMDAYADAQHRLSFFKSQMSIAQKKVNKNQNHDILSEKEYQQMRDDIRHVFEKEHEQLCKDLAPHLQAIRDAQKSYNNKAPILNNVLDIAHDYLLPFEIRKNIKAGLTMAEIPHLNAGNPGLINDARTNQILGIAKSLDK